MTTLATLHFENAFWSKQRPNDPLPDFQTGLQALHNKLNQSKVENDEFISFFKERITIEDNYANRLGDQAKGTLKSSGFGRDEGAVLKNCFENMRMASSRFGMQHKETATAMTDTVLKPLNKFQDEYKRSITTSKQSVDAALKQFDGLVKDMERAKVVYQKRWKEAMTAGEHWQQQKKEEETAAAIAAVEKEEQETVGDEDEERDEEINGLEKQDSQENVEEEMSDKKEKEDKKNEQQGQEEDEISNEMILIGNQRMSRVELNSMVSKMRSEVKVGDYRVPILGKYQNTSTGENISIWLQHNLSQCKDSPAMADVVAQQLIHPLGILRLVGQRGNKFSPSPQSYYQWQNVPQQQQQQQVQKLKDQEDDSSTGTASNYGFGFFERIGGQPIPGEEVFKRAQKEAALADEAYRAAVKRNDQMRMVVEQALFAHFAEMEQVELKRLTVLKQAIASFSLCISEMLPGDKAIVDQMLVYQESLKPEQDIQYIIQQYCVSSFSPKPILYDNLNHGVAQDQIFGVPLNDLGKIRDDKVPKFIHCLLEAVDKGRVSSFQYKKRSEALDEKEKQQLWSARLPLDRIHAICADLNIPSSQITVEQLQQYEPVTLVAILRLYLLELPECLMTFEFYDAVQALYTTSNVEQDDNLRVPSLSNLIATLPGIHFATLKYILSYIHKAVQQDDIQAVGQSFGPVILRPRVESLATLTSPMPTLFAKDLLNHYDTVFSESTLKSHAESEKRRQARPLIATNYPLTMSSSLVGIPTSTSNATNNNDASSPPAPSPTKPRRGIMSFMRGNNNSNSNETSAMNNTDTNRWMGVFQRNNSVSSSSASTNSSSEQQRASFSRPTPPIPTTVTAITQGSPPSSPTMRNNTGINKEDSSSTPSSTISKVEDNKSEGATTKQIVFDATEESHNDNGELDPFFDDD
ncbi:hypothetical protein INT45_008867 [Circinella minor]|uniref:Rho-GAP domain-containing protein n=1 Tax=Circinella minor TaxID=1195481 RepID=A0A8H7RZ15_9FUNG|nr:hypothetical protein INT45_008867 [Circinella minor]